MINDDCINDNIDDCDNDENNNIYTINNIQIINNENNNIQIINNENNNIHIINNIQIINSNTTCSLSRTLP